MKDWTMMTMFLCIAAVLIAVVAGVTVYNVEHDRTCRECAPVKP